MALLHSAEQLRRECGAAGRRKYCYVNCCTIDLFFFFLADPWSSPRAFPSMPPFPWLHRAAVLQGAQEHLGKVWTQHMEMLCRVSTGARGQHSSLLTAGRQSCSPGMPERSRIPDLGLFLGPSTMLCLWAINGPASPCG